MLSEKLLIEAKNGQVLIGSAFHTLEDKSRTTFKAQNLDAFKAYLRDQKEAVKIYCELGLVRALPVEIDRYSRAIAEITFKESEPLRLLANNKNTKRSLSDFTELLESMKRFDAGGVLSLLNSLRSFKLQKIVSVAQTNDRRGNFAYSVQMEKGKDDLLLPETISFEVPIFNGHPNKIIFTFELLFDPSRVGSGGSMDFTLQNFNWDELLEEAKIQLINWELLPQPPVEGKEAPAPLGLVVWGAPEIHVINDAWKYLENAIPDGPPKINRDR
jgi:hypothetical protein